MPIPATTGQLRNNIQDMEIGDYIVWECKGGHWSFGVEPSTEECPVTGVSESFAARDRYFYGVKVDKGLLIADRVARHSVSWDGLNGGKLIEGMRITSANAIPAMVSNTSPSGVASASVNEDGTYAAWKAFNRVNAATNATDAWSGSMPLPQWLSYEFPDSKVIKGYSIAGYNGANPNNRSPKEWTFEGWDGTEWVVLDRRTNEINWNRTETRFFHVNNSQYFKKYRFNFLASNDSSLTLGVLIGEIEMFEAVGVMRSITGGSSYAAEFGKSSTTDKGLGAWPPNNEWEKYIDNFPPNLIQEGKTVNDIFNTNRGVATWCKDTPVQGVVSYGGTSSNSSHRIARPNNNSLDFPFTISLSSSTTGVGFRPVFEYVEV